MVWILLNVAVLLDAFVIRSAGLVVWYGSVMISHVVDISGVL